MLPDSAGRGWDSSENLSQHISSLFEKGAKRDQKWVQNWPKNVKNGVQKGIRKTTPKTCEKYRKRWAQGLPNGDQNLSKIHPKTTSRTPLDRFGGQGVPRAPKRSQNEAPGTPQLWFFDRFLIENVGNNQRKTTRTPQEKQRETTARLKEKHRQTIGQSQENHRKITGEP